MKVSVTYKAHSVPLLATAFQTDSTGMLLKMSATTMTLYSF